MATCNVAPEIQRLAPLDLAAGRAPPARWADRPMMALRALAEVTRGEDGWTHTDFSADTLDILVDGVVSGRLTRCPEGWFILDAEGALRRLAYHVWPDHAGGTEGWPDGVLADVREALER